MLDTEQLRTAPLHAIYFMHMQPPLLNLLYAAALALPGGTGFLLLQILFVGSSLLIVGMLYAFLRRFGARPWAAGCAAALFGVLPQVLLYENIYFYSHLEAVLVLAATLFASAYFEQRRLASFIGFAACLVVLGLLRSLFHIGWIVVVLAVTCAAASRHPGWVAALSWFPLWRVSRRFGLPEEPEGVRNFLGEFLGRHQPDDHDAAGARTRCPRSSHR